MAIVESKLKSGHLVLGGSVFPAVAPAVDFSCQPTNVRIEPAFNDVGDSVETLCGDKTSPDTEQTQSMMGTAIQDWDGPAGGLVAYSWEHSLETVPFLWAPNVDLEITGNVQIRALVLGGDVNARLTSDFEWPATDVEPTWPTTMSASAAA